MIKKLRIRFVLLSMSVLLAVLVVVIGGINIANYASTVQEADQVLDLLEDNQGRFPMGRPGGKFSPELAFESRYFTVLLDSTGQAVFADLGNIAAVDRDNAISMAKQAARENDRSGFLGHYRYRNIDEGNMRRIIILDCGRKLFAFRQFLTASVLISLAGFLVVLVIVAALSGRVVRPFAESYEKQKQFITDAGHELKTPLTIIGADADILQMEQGESEWLSDIQKQVKHLTALTNDLVFLTRMEEAGRTIPRLPFALSDVVAETAASFQALAQNKNFTISIQPGLSMTGDEKSIAQLVGLLLDNALKYSPAGGSVSLTLEKSGRQNKLCVYNTTADPLPQERLELLFERFYRADASRNSATGGHGIGLSVAKAIVTAHGGKIQASSADGQSLLITVLLPT